MKYAVIHPSCSSNDDCCKALFARDSDEEGWYWSTSYQKARLFNTLEDAEIALNLAGESDCIIVAISDEFSWRNQPEISS